MISTLCLAFAIYWEARSEPFWGQIAVAHVIMNRVKDSRYPNTECDVVYDDKQFSFYHDGKSDKPRDNKAWLMAKETATRALVTPDTTEGSTHYHAEYVAPFWSKNVLPVMKTGKHLFYRL